MHSSVVTDAPTPDMRVDAAEWYAARLAEFGGRVECVVPRGYAAYARILHPANGPDGARVPWTAVAAAMGTVVHPLVQFASLAGRVQYDERAAIGWPGENPTQGTLDVDQLSALCRVLSERTATGDECWLTVWEGWGNLPSEWRRSAPRIRQPHRAYYVFRRPLHDVVGFSVALHDLRDDSSASSGLLTRSSDPPGSEVSTAHTGLASPTPIQSPSQWWPADRSWCAATEVDFDSTLVGGSDALIADIISDPGLEAFQVGPTDDLTCRGDTMNPLPPH